jgi:hypothetical protein
MSSPILPIVHAITSDRIREAEAARLVREVTPEPSQRPRRRRIRTVASLAFSALR